MSDPLPTSTQPAAAIPSLAMPQTEESFETVLQRQLQKPKVEKFSMKSLSELPNVETEIGEPLPVGEFNAVSDVDSENYLKLIETQAAPEEPKEKKSKKKEEPVNDFSLDDLDLSKDPEPVESKGKKSKEDNIAELRKKAEAYEETLKTKDTEVLTYKEKLEKLEAELERTAFERSPKFKNKYETPYNASIEAASAFAKEIADDASIAEKALSLKGRERLEFIDESFGGGCSCKSISLTYQ